MKAEGKVLITGASGLVGSSLCARLTNSRTVRAAVRNPALCKFQNEVEVVTYELSQRVKSTELFRNVSNIVHCAARVHVMNEQASDPLLEFRRANVEGTLSLARNAAEAGIQRFVFVSSIKVNGEATELGHPITADDMPTPQDPYGVSKMEAEQGLRELSAQTGMEVVIIRPPLIYGPGVKANFASMMRWLSQGIPLPLGGITTNRRSLVYVENLVDLIRVCIEHPKAANQTFLVSDDDDVSTTMLIRKMAKALGCPARLASFPPALVQQAAKLIGKADMASRLCGSLQVDITKTKEVLGWQPKFSLDEGLRRTAMPMVIGSNK